MNFISLIKKWTNIKLLTFALSQQLTKTTRFKTKPLYIEFRLEEVHERVYECSFIAFNTKQSPYFQNMSRNGRTHPSLTLTPFTE